MAHHIGPFGQGHDKFELVTTIEFSFLFFAADLFHFVLPV